MNLPNRKFGIELEISRRLVNAGDDERAKNHIWDKFRNELFHLIEKGQIDRHWKVAPDSSCGGEVVSPPMIGPDGLRQVGVVCQWAKKFAKNHGKPLVDGECGLHLHFDASDITPKILSNIFVLLHAIEPAIYSMYPDRNHRYCAPIDVNITQAARFRDFNDVRDVWYRGSNNVKERGKIYPSAFINSTAAGEHYDGTRYHGFNIHCYWSIGTIEFRYAPGNFDLNHIKSYYELCLSIITTAKKAADAGEKIAFLPNSTDKNYSQLLQMLQQNYRFRKYLIDVSKMAGLPRSTVGFMVRRLKEVNGSIMVKDPSVVPTFVMESNKDKFIYQDRSTGAYYDHNAKMISTMHFNGRRIIECVRETAKNGDIILIPSRRNVHMDITLVIEKAGKKKTNTKKAVYFFREPQVAFVNNTITTTNS